MECCENTQRLGWAAVNSTEHSMHIYPQNSYWLLTVNYMPYDYNTYNTINIYWL